MTIIKGQRYWERGDKRHAWVVRNITDTCADGYRYAILVSEVDDAEKEVELSRLQDKNYYTPAPDDPHHVDISSIK